MAKINLTAGRVRDFSSEGKQQSFLWDSGAPGLGVRATAGAKVYVFQCRFDGKSIRLKIGDTDAGTISDARQEARRLQTLVDQGTDPRTDKQDRLIEVRMKKAEVDRQKVTLSEAWDKYLEDRRIGWSSRHLADHIHAAQRGGEPLKRGQGKTRPGPLAALLDVPLVELTTDRIRAWAKKEAANRGTQTRIAFDCLRACVNWCADQPEYAGLAAVEAFNRRNRKEALPKRGAKDDCLQREQLAVWFQATREIKSPIVSAYLQGLLLTGARRNELAALKWLDVDFKWLSMTIRDKVDGERTIPLTPYCAALLATLPRYNEWVFSSVTSASGRMEEPRRAHERALARAGIDHLTLHGLRRSFSTLSEWIEVPVGVVAQIMGHKPSATAERHYKKRPLDLLRLWHVRIEGWILEQAGIAQPEETTDPGVLRIVK